MWILLSMNIFSLERIQWPFSRHIIYAQLFQCGKLKIICFEDGWLSKSRDGKQPWAQLRGNLLI